MEKEKTAEQKNFWWREDGESKQSCAIRYRPGQVCPQCAKDVLAYDGLFMLACPACGHIAESGAFT